MMIGTKLGTRTWSEAPQVSSLKADHDHLLSAQQEKQFGDQSVGDIANKIANPNYVTTHQLRGVGSNKLGKDAFMRLMLTQMKNQDPTNPMKSYEMAAQLAQFSSLEQLFNIDHTLTSMNKAQGPIDNFQALTFIGKDISGDSADILRAKGDKHHAFEFQLPQAASDVRVSVRGSTGDIVRTYTLRDLQKGNHQLVWNGQDKEGRPTLPGAYTFIVDAKSSNGQNIPVKTAFSGRVTGINYTDQGPVLLIGDQTVKLSDVKKIIDPNLEAAAQLQNKMTFVQDQATPKTSIPGEQTNALSKVVKPEAEQTNAPSKIAVKPEAGKTGPAENVPNNLQTVAMSDALNNKLSHELQAAKRND